MGWSQPAFFHLVIGHGWWYQLNSQWRNVGFLYFFQGKASSLYVNIAIHVAHAAKGLDFSISGDFSMLMRSFEKFRPPQEIQSPAWRTSSMYFQSFMKASHKPLLLTSDRNLILKMCVFLVLASAKWVRELHIFSFDFWHLREMEIVYLLLLSRLCCQDDELIYPRCQVRGVNDSTLHNFAGVDKNEMLLHNLVWVVRCYIRRIWQYRPACSHLMLIGQVNKEVSKHIII